MQTTQADLDRHTAKIEIYRAAVERVGFNTIVDAIGITASGAFVVADAEMTQRQYPNHDLIGSLLGSAQSYGENFCNINDADHSIYDVLKAL